MVGYSAAIQSIGEAPRPEAGNWGGIIDTLYQEHGYIHSLLDALDKETQKLAPGKIPDYPLLFEMLEYLLHYPNEYHHPREDLLFADLRKLDPDFRPSYERLQREHRTLHAYCEELHRQLDAVVQGRRADRKSLSQTLNKFIAAYRQHISFESREIFPKARGSLSPAQLKRIEAKTRYRDDPLFGMRARGGYKRLGKILQARISDLEQAFLLRETGTLEGLLEGASEAVESFRNRPSIAERMNCGASGATPSWQARVLNSFTRSFMKPMMRLGSIDSMRSITARLDAQQEKILAEDIRWKKVSKPGYEGEWINIAGKRPRKVLLYFPGGAFIMRTAVQHKSFVARICRAAHTRALLVHYRLAPETPFPGGLEDCLAAYHDLLEQGIKAENITLAGDSAGGGLVLSTLLALRDENSPLPANAIVLSPLGDLTYSGKSRKFNQHLDPMLPTHRASSMHELYVGDALPEDRYISPVLADFDGLPPILGQVGSTEILLSDSVFAAERAREADVPFYLEIWEQMPHVFAMFSILPESEVAIERIATFIANSKLDPLPGQYGRSEAEP